MASEIRRPRRWYLWNSPATRRDRLGQRFEGGVEAAVVLLVHLRDQLRDVLEPGEDGSTHFYWARGETSVQSHGIGPWGVTYVNPADDPRKK